jgi:hypothetical protein
MTKMQISPASQPRIPFRAFHTGLTSQAQGPRRRDSFTLHDMHILGVLLAVALHHGQNVQLEALHGEDWDGGNAIAPWFYQSLGTCCLGDYDGFWD